MIRWYLICIFITSLVIRCGLAYKVDQMGLENGVRHFACDAASYDYYGWQIAQDAHINQNYFNPGYTLFVAMVYKVFGHQGLPVMCIQAVMGACAILLIFDLTRLLFGLQAAFIASGLAVFSRLMIRFSVHYFAESPAIFFLILFLWLMIKFLKSKKGWYLWHAGLCLGWAAFFRMPVLLFVVPFLIYILIFSKTRKYNPIFISWFIFVLLVFLPTFIITYRNYKYNKVLVISHNPVNAHIAWSKDKYGVKLNSLGFTPIDNLKQSVQVFMKNPVEISILWIKKIAFNIGKFFLHDNLGVIDLFFISPHKFRHYQWIFQISWIIPVIGLYINVKKFWIKQWATKSNEVAIFTLMMFLLSYYTLVHSIFLESINRYRMPVHFIILSLTGAGLWHIWIVTKNIVSKFIK